MMQIIKSPRTGNVDPIPENLGTLQHVMQHVDEYFDHKDLKTKTREAYTSILNLFFDHFHLVTDPIVYAHVNQYKAHLRKQNKSQHYVRHTMNVIRGFFKYLDKAEIYRNAVWDMVKSPQMSTYQGTDKPVFSDDEIRKMFKVARGKMDSITNYRNYAIIRLLQGSGFRIGEVINLNVGDLKEKAVLDQDKKLKKIWVIEYTQKKDYKTVARVFPKTVKAIKAYLSRRGVVYPEDPMFCSHPFGEIGQGKRIAHSSIRQSVKEIIVSSGADPRCSSHSFRHTLAVKVYNLLGDEHRAGQQLRHLSPKTIQYYTKQWRAMLAAEHSVDVEVK